MKLQEIFDQLSSGEFSQLSIGGANQGVIDATNYSKVLGHVNLGLNALYRRFNLKGGRLVLALQPGLTTYKLNSAFAVNGVGSTEPVRYIKDTLGDPFTDDIIKVEQLLTATGKTLGLNDDANLYSVFTPSALTLRMPIELVTDYPSKPDDLKTATVTVVYRATIAKIVAGVGFAPATVEVQLPDTHLEPLLYYVASRVTSPIGMSNEFHMGNSYYAKYEAACQGLEGKGLQIDQDSQNTRILRGGWV